MEYLTVQPLYGVEAMRRGLAASASFIALLFALPASAEAVDMCPEAKPARQVVRGTGVMESIISDDKGRLFYTDQGRGALMRLDGPGATPKPLTQVEAGGGLAFDDEGKLFLGSGTSIPGGALGTLIPMAKLFRVDPETGAKTLFASGLAQANAIARTKDGTIFATNDLGVGLDRITRDGRVQSNWANPISANGAVLSLDERHLYIAQTFQPPAIQRIEIANPSRIEHYASPDTNPAAGLDGLAIDEKGRLFVTANGAGEVWRVDTNRKICAVLKGLPMLGPSAVAFGGGTDGQGFPSQNLYVVSFQSQLLEVPDQRPPQPSRKQAKPPLKLTVRPKRVKAGRRVTLSFGATYVEAKARKRVDGAKLRFGGRFTRTAGDGRKHVVVRFSKPGKVKVRAEKKGLRSGNGTIRVVR